MKVSWLGWIGIAAAVVCAAALGAHAFVHFTNARYRDGIVVAGSATRRIRSDRAVWTATVSARGATPTEAYAILQRDVPRVRQFLVQHGVPESEIAVEAAVTDEIYAHDNEGQELREQIVAYVLSQSVKVTSPNIDRVKSVANDVTSLIASGVYVESSEPEYIYTRLGHLKIALVGEATADARARAQQVASRSHSQLGRLVSAHVGVVQVNAEDRTDVSWEGTYDRSTVNKDVMVVVRTIFELES